MRTFVHRTTFAYGQGTVNSHAKSKVRIKWKCAFSQFSYKHEKKIRHRTEHDNSRLSWRFEKCETVNVSLAVACSICAIVSTMFLTKLECALFDCLSKKQRRTAQLGVLEQQLFVRYRSGLLSCSFVLRTFDILG